ncbi:hypothetical protein F511_03935 [Dorcoceras hygrometricum]|uniref:Uncharacterized protein n=1 Tax=Dorcoceras hygrometricum TaxID=472368 RepID=A0A2Z7A6X3_9LAMI|nr:hypothetical protein F511_03935 [Dorcoceras hygrometricum]
MRIRPSEFETSICDLKYHVSLIAIDSPIRSTTRSETPSSGYTRSPDEISTNGFSSSNWPETNFRRRRATAALGGGGGGL